MGHAGAVISGGKDTAEAKFEAMRQAGIHVAESPAALGSTMIKAIHNESLHQRSKYLSMTG
jgi:succinyl-CoA synthetase alpha subunit